MWTGLATRRRLPSFFRCLAAGAGGGVVAAVADRALSALVHSGFPPALPEAGSAFVAGVVAGVLFWSLSRISRRPAAWLWAIGFGVATAASLLIAIEPLAPPIRSLSFIGGLMAPLMQILGLLGAGRLGGLHLPVRFLGVDTAVHYLTAAAICPLVPRFARRV